MLPRGARGRTVQQLDRRYPTVVASRMPLERLPEFADTVRRRHRGGWRFQCREHSTSLDPRLWPLSATSCGIDRRGTPPPRRVGDMDQRPPRARNSTQEVAVGVGLDSPQRVEHGLTVALGGIRFAPLEAVRAGDPQIAAVDRRPLDVHFAVGFIGQVEKAAQTDASVIAESAGAPGQTFHRRGLVAPDEECASDVRRRRDVFAKRHIDVRDFVVRQEVERDGRDRVSRLDQNLVFMLIRSVRGVQALVEMGNETQENRW